MAATDERLNAEIFSYSRNRGLFAGIALDGAWIGMDTNSNEEFYGNGMSPAEILAADNMPVPLSATQLVGLIAAAAPDIGINNVAASRSAMLEPAADFSAEPAPSEVRVYGLEPADDEIPQATDIVRDETMF